MALQGLFLASETCGEVAPVTGQMRLIRSLFVRRVPSGGIKKAACFALYIDLASSRACAILQELVAANAENPLEMLQSEPLVYTLQIVVYPPKAIAQVSAVHQHISFEYTECVVVAMGVTHNYDSHVECRRAPARTVPATALNFSGG